MLGTRRHRLSSRLLTRSRSRCAAASVEFALVSLVFFTILLGLVEFGRGLMVSYALMHAARQGVRTGILDGSTTADVTAAATSALDRASVKGATVTVRVNNQDVDASSATAGDKISVTVSIPVTSVTWLPGVHHLVGTLRGNYTLRRE